MRANYADYSFYSKTYGGTALFASTFTAYAARASMYMDTISSNKLIDNLPSDETGLYKVNYCCCALADELKKIDDMTATVYENNKTGDYVKSMSSGGESVTYGQGALAAAVTGGQKAINVYLMGIAKTYLSHVSDDDGYYYLYEGIR